MNIITHIFMGGGTTTQLQAFTKKHNFYFILFFLSSSMSDVERMDSFFQVWVMLNQCVEWFFFLFICLFVVFLKKLWLSFHLRFFEIKFVSFICSLIVLLNNLIILDVTKIIQKALSWWGRWWAQAQASINSIVKWSKILSIVPQEIIAQLLFSYSRIDWKFI